MKLAGSASSLGAAILGFGLGAKWGTAIASYALIVILLGIAFHISGMYVMQLKEVDEKSGGLAKGLWISAWFCLVILVITVTYLLVANKNA